VPTRGIFLTHRDDVAEAGAYAKQFGAKRIIHKYDQDAQPDAEIVIEGKEPKEFSNDFLIIPVPGHTRGHMVLLWKNEVLFTGDHLALDRKSRKPYAFRDYCWYSWEKQTESMRGLLNYSFEWILCGHGQWGYLPKQEMHAGITALVKEMSL
jgi:glyoxylase-like metal-dependent hydrolase (beta-lactamase superfamily II)